VFPILEELVPNPVDPVALEKVDMVFAWKEIPLFCPARTELVIEQVNRTAQTTNLLLNDDIANPFIFVKRN